MENAGLNNHTTVVPLTEEWMTEMGCSVDDGYGPYFILEKFLASLPEYKTEIADAVERAQSVEGLVLQCGPCTSHNQMSSTYRCSQTTSKTVSKHISDADLAETIPSEEVLLGNIEHRDYHAKSVGLLPFNKVDLEGFMGQAKPVLCGDPGIEAWQYLSRSQAGSMYYSEEEDWMSKGLMGYCIGGPDGDSMEERLAHHIPSVPDGQQPESSREEDPSEVDQQPDCGTDEAYYSYLLDPIEVNQQYLQDPFEVDQQSESGTEEVFYLLDPFEVPLVHKRQNSNPKREAVVGKRLSRYDLFYGPTHRARSPSCPLIGARGDSRERSPISSDNSEVCVLQHVALQCHKGKDNGVRANRKTAMQTVTWRTHCSSSRTPFIVNPLLGCPCWLLLMGLPTLATAMIDAKQKLGKLLEGGPQGQPHRQPLTGQITTLSSVNIQGGRPVLCYVGGPMATDIQLSGMPQWLPPSLCTYQCEP